MTKVLTMLLLLALVAISSGCAGQTAPQPAPQPTPAAQDTSSAACTSAPTQANGKSGEISLFYTCSGDVLPSSPRAVLREIPSSEAQVKAALEELVKGPTAEEQAQGFSSFFSNQTAGMVKSVTVTDEGRAVVDFADVRDKMPNASTSAGSGQLIQELSKTIFQFDQIKEVEFRFDGSCDAFFHWLQSDCHAISAADYR